MRSNRNSRPFIIRNSLAVVANCIGQRNGNIVSFRPLFSGLPISRNSVDGIFSFFTMEHGVFCSVANTASVVFLVNRLSSAALGGLVKAEVGEVVLGALRSKCVKNVWARP